MKLTERIRKTNWLNELRVVVIFGILLATGQVVFEVVQVAAGDGPVVVEIRQNPNPPEEFELGGHAARQQSSKVEILDPTGAQAAWYLGTELPTAAVLLAALLMLLRMLTKARQANTFTRATVRDLRWTALILIGGGSLASVIESVARMGLTTTLDTGQMFATWRIPALWWLMGFGAMAVAQIVTQGEDMREELEGVV